MMTAEPAASLPSRRAYFLGTPFCGSSVFGQALGAHGGVTYLGEVDRLVMFPPSVFPDQPEPTCHYCELRGQPCPVWTPDRIEAFRGTEYGLLMDTFEDQLGHSALVDGSKNPGWVRAVFGERPVDAERTVVFVTIRSPFAFCDSFRFRTGCEIWQAANMWRDVYYDAMRMVARAGLPSMVVRYEDFAMNPEAMLRPACSLLGIAYEPQMPYFQSQPGHAIGGNYSAQAAASSGESDFSATAFRERLPSNLAHHMDQAASYWGKPFGGWVDDKWQANMSGGDVEQVLQTPGLADVAALLGYELTREVAAWQTRRASESTGA